MAFFGTSGCIYSGSRLSKTRIIDKITLFKQNVSGRIGCTLKHCQTIGLLKKHIGLIKTIRNMVDDEFRLFGDGRCSIKTICIILCHYDRNQWKCQK